MKPLTNTQKAALCQLARQAYDYQTPDQSFEDWRRYEQFQSCGKYSLTEASQDDYLKIRSSFESLAGNEKRAFATAMQAESEPHTKIYGMIDTALRERDLTRAYAQSICQRQYKCNLEDATEKQLWGIFYTIRNRRKAVKAVKPRKTRTDGFTITPHPEPRTKAKETADNPF